jgi:hypothetical protein
MQKHLLAYAPRKLLRFTIQFVAITSGLLASSVGVSPSEEFPPAPQTPGNPVCSIQQGHLVADFPKGSPRSIFSLVFKVFDQHRRGILTEVVPVNPKDSLLRIYDEPLDEDQTMVHSSSVACYTTPLMGASKTVLSPLCQAPVPVDMGVGITVRAVEILPDRIFFEVTAGLVMLGAIQIQKLHGESLYLRSVAGEPAALKRLRLWGPNPTTVVLGTAFAKGSGQVLQLGINNDTPLITICL